MNIGHKLLTFLLLLTILSACSKRPEGVLSEKEMVDIMADIQIAQAMADTRYRTPGTGSNVDYSQLTEGILAAHNVSREELDSTLSWYGHNMDSYSDLYTKVDKELRKRAKKYAGSHEKQKKAVGDDRDLWPYLNHALLSKRSASPALFLSIDKPLLNKGDKVVWKLRINSTMASTTSVLGAEYSDGTTGYVVRHNSGRRNIETEFQTDSSKTVKRLFGSFRPAREGDLPLWVDSISLRKSALDSMEYFKLNQQIFYRGPSKRKSAIQETIREEDAGLIVTPGQGSVGLDKGLKISPDNNSGEPMPKLQRPKGNLMIRKAK